MSLWLFGRQLRIDDRVAVVDLRLVIGLRSYRHDFPVGNIIHLVDIDVGSTGVLTMQLFTVILANFAVRCCTASTIPVCHIKSFIMLYPLGSRLIILLYLVSMLNFRTVCSLFSYITLTA